jgi:hypothetical protein
MRVAHQSEVFVFGERRKLGRSGQSCCCQEVTAQARARTMPTARIACDVNAAEEMELERLGNKVVFTIIRFAKFRAKLG